MAMAGKFTAMEAAGKGAGAGKKGQLTNRQIRSENNSLSRTQAALNIKKGTPTVKSTNASQADYKKFVDQSTVLETRRVATNLNIKTEQAKLIEAKKKLVAAEAELVVAKSELNAKNPKELKELEGESSTDGPADPVAPVSSPGSRTLVSSPGRNVRKATEAVTEAKKTVAEAKESVAKQGKEMSNIVTEQRKLILENPEVFKNAPESVITDSILDNPTTPGGIAMKNYFKTGNSLLSEVKAAADANPGDPVAQGRWNRVKTAFSKLSIGGTYTKIGAVLVTLGLGGALAFFITKKDGDESSVALGGACYQTFSKDPTITGAVFVNCGQNECNCSSKCVSPKCDSTDGKARGVAYTWLTNPPANISPTEAVNALGDAINEALKAPSPSPSSSTSIMTIIIYAVIIAFVCAAAFIGYKIYLKRKGVQPITQNFTFNRRTKHKKY